MRQGRGTSSPAQDWPARVKGDLALALAPLPDGAFYEDLCFHAQQAAEKAIKAVYQKHNLAFRYTHDLRELLAGLRDRGVSIPSEVEDSEILAAYASEYRYPSVTEPVTIEEYQQATHHASKVLQWAEAMIADDPA